MESFDDLDNKRDFKKIFIIGGSILLLAIVVTILLLNRKGNKEVVEVGNNLGNGLSVPTKGIAGETPIFSPEVLSWNNYFWPEKLNLKYPSNWELIEMEYKNVQQTELEEATGNKTKGEIVGLKLVPPTGDPKDEIIIGGRFVSCADAKKYSQNKCLKNKIQVPFYTDSQNTDILSAFDLIFQNALLVESLK